MPPRNRRSSSKPELSPVRRRSQKQAGGPWNFGPIPVIGLVGGIGSGKSTVAQLMAARGAQVIDADKVGHALLDQKPSREAVVARFGADILMVDDPERVNRAALGKIVFADPQARLTLERILHPRMKRTFEKAIARTIRRGTSKMIVLDAAILFEAGWNEICDMVVFVDSPRNSRLARLRESRGWTAADLSTREEAQWPLERKKELADLTITNNGDLEKLDRELIPIAKRIRLTRGDWFRAKSQADEEPPQPGPVSDVTSQRGESGSGKRSTRTRQPNPSKPRAGTPPHPSDSDQDPFED